MFTRLSLALVLSAFAACTASPSEPTEAKTTGAAASTSSGSVPKAGGPETGDDCPATIPAIGDPCHRCSTPSSTSSGAAACPKCFYRDQPENVAWPYGEDRVCCDGVWKGQRGGGNDGVSCANIAQ